MITPKNDWRETTPHSPTKRDGDATGCVLVWHIYNGCMVTGAKIARDSSFISHWMPLPKGPGGAERPAQDMPMAGALRRWNQQTGALEAMKDEE